jgi:hypothetical protein
MAHLEMVYPLKIVIFNSYVSLPEGNMSVESISKNRSQKSRCYSVVEFFWLNDVRFLWRVSGYKQLETFCNPAAGAGGLACFQKSPHLFSCPSGNSWEPMGNMMNMYDWRRFDVMGHFFYETK